MPVTRINARIGLPLGVGEIGGEWEPDDAERKAAWEMYVELVTRISVVELGDDDGLIREALSSLYSLFGTTRAILRSHGPSVAIPADDRSVSFAQLAVAILNHAVRPFLARWHPVLEDHEHHRPKDRSRRDWEREWQHHDEVRAELRALQDTLAAYAGVLGDVTGAKSLLHGARWSEPDA